MATAKLTKSYIDGLAAPVTGELLVWDETLTGFGLRVSPPSEDYPKGKRTFLAQARIGRGRKAPTRRWNIGPYGKLTPDEARTAARERLRDMVLGIDPRSVNSEAKTITLRQVAEKYMRERILADKTKSDYEKMLAGPFAKFGWTDKPLANIRREDVLKAFIGMRDQSPVYANSTFGTLRSFFNYAMNEWPEDFTNNPVKILFKKWAPTKARTDRIPDDKLGPVWRYLQDARQTARQRLEVTSVDLVSFILLTGCRLSEACELTWDRVNLDERWWHISDPKNGNAVWLPLSRQAVELLRNRPTREGFVFATTGGHLTDPRKTMRNVSKVAGWELSPHSLRRSFTQVGTRLCKIDTMIVARLTNHVARDVMGIHYDNDPHLQHLEAEVQAIADRIAGGI